MKSFVKTFHLILISVSTMIFVMATAPMSAATELAPYFNIENPPPSGPALGSWPTTGLMDAYQKAGLRNAMITLGDIGGQDDCPDINVVQQVPLDDIKAFLATGGDLIFSMNGATCGNTAGKTLVDALTLVIQKTGIQKIDFDVEDSYVGSQSDMDRRNAAILELKKRFPNLLVSFTLGATPELDWNTDPNQAGLFTAEYTLVKNTLASGAKIDRITIMPFGWGFSQATYQAHPFAELVEMTMESVADQMEVLFSPDPNHPLPREKIYSMLGILPDIGLATDNVDGPFNPSDALLVGNYAREKGYALVSFYVFQRDQKQDHFGPTTDEYLSQYSGIPQTDYQFFHCFEGGGDCSSMPATSSSGPASNRSTLAQ